MYIYVYIDMYVDIYTYIYIYIDRYIYIYIYLYRKRLPLLVVSGLSWLPHFSELGEQHSPCWFRDTWCLPASSNHELLSYVCFITHNLALPKWWPTAGLRQWCCRCTSLIRKCTTIGPYSRPTPFRWGSERAREPPGSDSARETTYAGCELGGGAVPHERGTLV